jgi:feruloyl-CoA synthase
VTGGSFYIDDGRPMGQLFQETLSNLAEVQPTGFSTVPAAYAMLVAKLEENDDFARTFFRNISNLGYGGASLPADIVRRLQVLSIKHIGLKTPISTAFGATETGPGGAFIYWPTDRTGLVGLPHAGFEVKLVPVDDTRFELRIRGDAVTKGYYGRPDLNKDIFDEDGFYKIGDTVRLADPENILEGLVFAGRLSEEFKLTSGTFVLVGSLRIRVLDTVGPLFSDIVICGENQAYIGAMAWLNVDVAKKVANRPDATREELNVDPTVTALVKEKILAYNTVNSGQSNRIKRILLLDEPPSIDKNEITDKGSINQRGVQRNRPELVASLFKVDAPSYVLEL